MAKTNIDYLLAKLRSIHYELGGAEQDFEGLSGPGAALSRVQKKDKFRLAKIRIDEAFHRASHL
jgi:hypothetical protein